MKITEFDKRKEYKEYIAPLVQQLKSQCELHNIPMFVTCAVSNSADDGTTFERDCIGPGSNDIHLVDDQITKHYCVANGFIVSPPNVVPTLDEAALEYINADDLD